MRFLLTFVIDKDGRSNWKWKRSSQVGGLNDDERNAIKKAFYSNQFRFFNNTFSEEP